MPTPPSINKMRRAVKVFIEGGYYAPFPAGFVYSLPGDPQVKTMPQSTAIFVVHGAVVFHRAAFSNNVPYPLGSFVPNDLTEDTFLFTSPLCSVRNEAVFILGMLRFLFSSPFTIRRFPLHDGKLYYTLTASDTLDMPGTQYELPLEYDPNRIPI